MNGSPLDRSVMWRLVGSAFWLSLPLTCAPRGLWRVALVVAALAFLWMSLWVVRFDPSGRFIRNLLSGRPMGAPESE